MDTEPLCKLKVRVKEQMMGLIKGVIDDINEICKDMPIIEDCVFGVLCCW
jgi:hypothetical protein